MTEQEAIRKLNMLDEALNFQRADADESSCALQMAIEALEMISKRDELEDFNTLENYIAEWNKYKVFHSDEPTEELHWMHALIRYYMVQYKLYKDSELSPKEVLEMKTTYEHYRVLGTVEELRVARDKQVAKKPSKDEFDRYICPDCGWIVYTDEYGGRYLLHCENCGQKLDWEEV